MRQKLSREEANALSLREMAQAQALIEQAKALVLKVSSQVYDDGIYQNSKNVYYHLVKANMEFAN